jgi:hypothetical protein
MSRVARYAAVATLLLATGDAFAQSAPAQSSDPWCFRGQPLPRCRNILVYEGSWFGHVAGSQLTERFDQQGGGYALSRNVLASHLSVSLGVIRNVSPTTGVGALFDAGIGNDSYDRFALVGRYRRWLGGTRSLDVSLGPAIINANDPVVSGNTTYLEPHRRAALTGDVGLRLNDWLSGVVRFDAVPGHKPSAAGALYAGVRVASWPAVGGTALLAIWVATAIAAITGTDY